jgi:hypothetical protein
MLCMDLRTGRGDRAARRKVRFTLSRKIVGRGARNSATHLSPHLRGGRMMRAPPACDGTCDASVSHVAGSRRLEGEPTEGSSSRRPGPTACGEAPAMAPTPHPQAAERLKAAGRCPRGIGAGTKARTGTQIAERGCRKATLRTVRSGAPQQGRSRRPARASWGGAIRPAVAAYGTRVPVAPALDRPGPEGRIARGRKGHRGREQAGTAQRCGARWSDPRKA